GEGGKRAGVALFDADNNSRANRYQGPRRDKPFLCAYLDRMFLAGESPYTRGHVEVTAGSVAVVGVGTQFDQWAVGRFLYLTGGGRSYQVESVNAATQTLTLTGTYKQGTDPFGVYSLPSPPAEPRSGDLR